MAWEVWRVGRKSSVVATLCWRLRGCVLERVEMGRSTVMETGWKKLAKRLQIVKVPMVESPHPSPAPQPCPTLALSSGSRGTAGCWSSVSTPLSGAAVTQLALPLFFVGYAMFLARTMFATEGSDPKRRLGLRESSVGGNRTLFWAEFGPGAVGNNDSWGNSSGFFDFADPSLASSLGATDLLNYSDQVLQLISSSVQRGRDTAQCCGYRYQLLDKHCTSRTVEELEATCGNVTSFPYYHCRQCLSCCTSRTTRLPSCTRPLTQLYSHPESQFCPSSPLTSLQDLLHNSSAGPLDTYTAYVDEILMQLSDKVTAPVFTRRVMGGIVVQHRRDPPYSVCRCSDTETVCRRYFSSLRECGSMIGDSPVYVTHLPNFFLGQSEFCPALESGVFSSWPGDDGGSVSGDGGSGDGGDGGSSGKSGRGDSGGLGGCESVKFQGGYEVDGLAADSLGGDACNCTDGDKMALSAHYYQEPEEVLSVTVWYNNRPWHMSAAALNAFHNVWLRKATNNSNLRLTVNNHPLPRTNLNNLNEADVGQADLDGYYVGITVVFGYSFLVASFILVLVAEKESKAKHLQFVSGATVTSYWLANLTCDLLNSLLPLALSLAIIAAAQVEAYSGIALLAIACLLVMTCWSSIPIVYTASFLFTNSLVAFGVILVIFFLSCLIFLLVTLVVPDKVVKDSLHYVFLLNPAYALGVGLNDVYINDFLTEVCTFTPQAMQSCAENDVRYVDNLFSLDRPGIGLLFIYMAIEGLAFFILTLFIEVVEE
jgi:ATP-binding cassette subfamily A (ABC1) protein 3